MHARLEIGDWAVMLGRAGAEFRPPRPNEVNQYGDAESFGRPKDQLCLTRPSSR